jgi:hypothetical protein
MKRFEYKVFSKLINVEERLNELGEQGWELVAISGLACDFIMKREIQ